MYHYGGNNPVKYTDPDGEVAETAWDIFSLASGVASFVANVKEGNAKGAIIDALGIVADATAVALPCIPGGAGAAIKSARVTGAISNIAGGALTIQDGLENSNNLEVGIGLLQIVSGSGQLKNLSNKLSVNTSSLVPNPDDPFDFDAGNYNQKALTNARNEIKNTGTIAEPIIVKKLDDGTLQIQDGHHRWKAAQQMNLKTVPIEIIE